MTVIAMTREMGTLGKDVATELARRLDTAVVHHELVEVAGRRAAPDRPSAVTRHLSGPPAGKGNGANGQGKGKSNGNGRWRTLEDTGGYLTELEILELAATGNAIVRGWGAARLLRRVPHVLTVRVTAPMEVREAEMARRLGVDAREARREIQQSDAAHQSVFAAFFGTDWRDPENYDIVLNMERMDACTGAELLLAAARSAPFVETAASRRVLEDRLMEARIARAIREADDLEPRARDVHARVEEGSVRLYGLVRDRSASGEIERLVRACVPARAVVNEIARFRD